MIKRISILEDLLYLFLYVFGLIVPFVHTTSLLLILIIPFRIYNINNAYYNLKIILRSRYFNKLILIYLIIIFLIILSATLHLALDFSLVKTIINSILHLIIAAMLVAFYIGKRRDLKYILLLFLSIFLIQSLIEVFSFINPSFLNFVQKFQSSSSIEIADKFSGRRGLALAGTLFFGLSTIYGLVFILLTRFAIIDGGYKIKTILIGLILLIGGFFTGRTFFIGVGIAGLYYINSSLSIKKKINSGIKALIVLLSTIALFIAVIPDSLYDQIMNLFAYVFEAFFNYIETGQATTTSSSHLIEDMYFPLELKTLLFGDGRYTSPDGSYYMSTDAGYMRNILLFGVGGLLVCIYFDICLMFGTKKLRSNQNKLMSLFIFGYMLIIHYKGEVFAYLITLHCMLFILYLFIEFSHLKANDVRYFNMHL